MPAPKYRIEFDAIIIVLGDSIADAQVRAEREFPEDAESVPGNARAQFIGADSVPTVIGLDESGSLDCPLSQGEVEAIEALERKLANPKAELERIAKEVEAEEGDEDDAKFLRDLGKHLESK